MTREQNHRRFTADLTRFSLFSVKLDHTSSPIPRLAANLRCERKPIHMEWHYLRISIRLATHILVRANRRTCDRVSSVRITIFT